jgi:hypothetical protein
LASDLQGDKAVLVGLTMLFSEVAICSSRSL